MQDEVVGGVRRAVILPEAARNFRRLRPRDARSGFKLGVECGPPVTIELVLRPDLRLDEVELQPKAEQFGIIKAKHASLFALAIAAALIAVPATRVRATRRVGFVNIVDLPVG